MDYIYVVLFLALLNFKQKQKIAIICAFLLNLYTRKISKEKS